MPLITPFVPGGEWQTATLTWGLIVLNWGAFLAALINFIIMALVMFLLVKYGLRKKKVSEVK
jgi:large conductance mechanosensitive channel